MPIHISSVHNPRVRQAMRLRERRAREKQQRILIDGWREVLRAARSGVRLLEVYLAEDKPDHALRDELLASLAPTRVDQLWLTPQVFARLAYGQREQGVVAVAETPRRSLDDLRLPPQPLVAVLEAVEKPGNVGAVLRSADAAGVSAVVLADAGTDLFNPNAIRASLGTIFSLPVCTAGSGEARRWCVEQGLQIFAARVDGSIEYTEARFSGPTALVLGSEASGLSGCWQGPGVQAVRLPMLGIADSLNVSVTAAVLFFEALRQRRCGD